MKREPRYIILATDRVCIGFHVKRARAEELMDKYSPSSILPDAWHPYPVARLSVPVGVVTTAQK